MVAPPASSTVAAISSHVMRGTVGLRAITFPLMRRGHTVWAVPTVTMPWHPGFGPSTRARSEQLPAQLSELGANGAALDGVLTGYFADAAQVRAAASFIDSVRAVRPDCLVVVDPVVGDEAGRYVADAVAEAILDELVPRADIATPNVNELHDLGGAATVSAAEALGATAVVVTSAIRDDERVGSWLVEGATHHAVVHEWVRRVPRGTGDLFSALLLSAALRQRGRRGAERGLVHAVCEASAATLAAIKASGADHLDLAAAQESFAEPDTSAVTCFELPER